MPLEEHSNDSPVAEGSARPSTLIGRFDAQAAASPSRVALVGPSRSVTYGEADAASSAAAGGLLARFGPGTEPVALQFDHDVDLVLAILAVLRAGRPFTVLDPQAPVDLGAAVIADSRAVALLYGPTQADAARSIASDIAVSWEDLPATEPTICWTAHPDDIALLAYTSGSTGTPKAAAIPHRSLVHLMDGATDALGITAADRMPMLFPLSLAVATYPMFLPLVNGGSLHIFDMRSLGLAPFPEWLANQEISLIYFSPTVARFLEDAARGHHFESLRLVVLGGERVDDDAVAVVRRVFGSHVAVFNGYGTTETGVLCFYETSAGQVHGESGVPVGRPIAGMDILLVDGEGQAVGEEVVGEIVVRSEFLLAGYWQRPDLDALVLDVDPLSGTPTYRTGDLGRWRNGLIELVGRSDSEVKVRGHRVVPGEVEQALLSLPEVTDAAVSARPVSVGSNELVAWVVVAEGSDVDAIRMSLGRVVKATHLPTTYIELPELPQLPNGKLDRRGLPAPLDGRPSGLDLYAPPRTADEAFVVDIWQHIFQRDPIGVDDSFEALGGRSLDAAQMLILIEERGGVVVPMSDLLVAMTPAHVARSIARARERRIRRQDRSAVTIVTEQSEGRPLLFFAHDLHGTAYSLRFLAEALPNQPLAGFESPFLDSEAVKPTTLEDLAAGYVADIRSEQPVGPYHLAGYSFGGVLAFEMARQLTEAGDAVAFLGIFDVGPGYRGQHFHPRRAPKKPTLAVRMPPSDGTFAETARWYLDLARTSPRDVGESLAIRTGADRLLDRIRAWSDVRRTGSVRPSHRLWHAWQHHWELANGYSWEGRAYPGRLTLFWAEETGSTDGTMGWGCIVEDLDIVRLPILHETFLQESGAPVIAAALSRALGRIAEQ